MARKTRYFEYASHVAKEQAEKPAPAVKNTKSVLNRLSQLKEKTKTARTGATA